MKYFIIVLIMLVCGFAQAQSINSHHFEFSNTLETVSMEDAMGQNSELMQSKNPFLFRASFDYARNSLSATRVVSQPISIVEHLYSLNLGVSAIVHPRILVDLDGSLHIVHLSDAYVSGQFDASAWKLEDTRVYAKFRLTQDSASVNVAIAPSLYIPTGSSQYLVSNDGFRFGTRLIADMPLQRWKLYAHTGFSYASNATFLSLNEKTLLDVGLGSFYAINKKFGFNTEWLQSISMQDFKSGQNPTQVNVGIRYDSGSTKVFVGGGVQGFDFSNNNRPFVLYAGIKQPFGAKRNEQIVEPVSAVEQQDPEWIKAEAYLNNMVVYFEHNHASIKPEFHQNLHEAAQYMNQYSGNIQYLVLHGHTDPRGDAAYNKRLSQRRAQAVKDYLIGEGVNEYSILIDGYGETILKTTDEKEYSMDRRVEFQLMKK